MGVQIECHSLLVLLIQNKAWCNNPCTVLNHTAILALTILAIGNSVADWVADTVVAKYGKVEMAFASCFGSPLMSHVLGLSIALIVSFYSI